MLIFWEKVPLMKIYMAFYFEILSWGFENFFQAHVLSACNPNNWDEILNDL